MLKVVKAKKEEKVTNKGFKISPEWQLWFLDILSKNQSQSTSILAILYFLLKITVLSCFVGSFYQILCVFAGIWQYTKEIRKWKFL